MFLRNRPSVRTIAWGAALIVVIVAGYAGSLHGDFLWDDDLHITANATIVGPLGLKEIWTSARGFYFPLVLTNFWAQHALWELQPFGYRVVTLAFHGAAALLLWRVLLRLRVPGAWLGAALWALHPVQVESVAWICELKNTQSAVFFLAAILCWLRWLEVRPRAGASLRVYAAAIAFAVLAILSKPSTVMLPIALGLCAWWMSRRIYWSDTLHLVPFFALSALAAGWTIWEQKFNSGAIGEAWNQTLAERFAIAGRVIWFYLGKLIWPEPLIFIYPRWEISGTEPLAYGGLVAASVVATVLWRGRNGSLRPWFFPAFTSWPCSSRCSAFSASTFSGIHLLETISSTWPVWGRWRWPGLRWPACRAACRSSSEQRWRWPSASPPRATPGFFSVAKPCGGTRLPKIQPPSWRG